MRGIFTEKPWKQIRFNDMHMADNAEYDLAAIIEETQKTMFCINKAKVQSSTWFYPVKASTRLWNAIFKRLISDKSAISA